MRRRVTFVGAPFIGVVAALLVAACGGSGGSGGSGSSGGGSAGSVTVTATDSGFTPATVNLSKTGTYTIHEVNNAAQQVSIDIEGNGVDQDGKDISKGQSQDLSVDLSQAGTYQMHSVNDGGDRSHELHGTIVVKG